MNSKLAGILTLSLIACGGGAKDPAVPSTEGANPSAEANKDIKAPGEAKPGDVSRCTVTGEEIEVTAETPHAEHDGKTYYFCCAGCKKKFEADPTKFTKS